MSSAYSSPAWGKTDQPDFLNAVAQLATLLQPAFLLEGMKTIEQRLGRRTSERWGPREIDIDLLLYGRQELNLPDLIIPHPGLLLRSFVLIPLLEIAPDTRMPGGKPIRELADSALIHESNVRKLTGWELIQNS